MNFWDFAATASQQLSSLDLVFIGVAFLAYKVVATETAIKRQTSQYVLWLYGGVALAAFCLRLLIIWKEWK